MRILLLTFLLLLGTEVHANIPIGQEQHEFVADLGLYKPVWMVSDKVARANAICELRNNERHWNEEKCPWPPWKDFVRGEVKLEIVFIPSEPQVVATLSIEEMFLIMAVLLFACIVSMATSLLGILYTFSV